MFPVWQAQVAATAAYDKARYPAAPAHVWKDLLDERRLRQLRELQKEVFSRR